MLIVLCIRVGLYCGEKTNVESYMVGNSIVEISERMKVSGGRKESVWMISRPGADGKQCPVNCKPWYSVLRNHVSIDKQLSRLLN